MKIDGQDAVSRRQVILLENKLQRDFFTGVADDHKAHGIAGAIFWKPRTRLRVSQIAGLEVFEIDNQLLLLRCGAGAAPGCA